MIHASIYGRVGADPVERQTKGGKPMATMNIAVNVAGYSEEQEDTLWVGLAAFGALAAALARHRKGDLVAVMGPLARRHYKDRSGDTRESWQLTVESIVSARTVRPGGGKRTQKGGQNDALPFDDSV